MALKIFAKLPFGVAQYIGKCLGLLAYYIPNPIKKVAQINIENCFPHLTRNQQQQLVRKNLCHTLCSATEYGAWWLWSPEKISSLVRKVYGEEHLQAARAQGKGILIMAPHLGGWEVSQGYMPSRYRCAATYRPLRLEALEDFVKTARERGGGDLLPLTASGIREAHRRLAKGDLIGIMPDQVPGKNNGVFVPFFGIPAWTMTLAIRLAQQTGARVFFGYAERLKMAKGFDVYFMPASEDIYDPDMNKAAAAMNADIECCVNKIPEQYQWSYKRFKIQPNFSRKFYS